MVNFICKRVKYEENYKNIMQMRPTENRAMSAHG